MKYFKADKNHIELLTEMRIKYLREDFSEMNSTLEAEIRSRLPVYFEKHLNYDMFAYLADENGTTVASAFLTVTEKPANPNFPKGKVGTVMNVFTEKEFRRKGIASSLMKILIDDAKRLELDHIELKATDDGHKLYKSLGFSEVLSHYKEMKYFL